MHTLEQFKQHLRYDPDTGIFKWNLAIRRRKHGEIAGTVANGYLVLCVDGKTYRAHRVAWLFMTGEWPKQEIDHINGKRQDNRFANLRDVSRAVNAQGARKLSPRNKTGHTGVYWNQGKGMYTASVMRNGKSKFLGCFNTLEEAVEARKNHENIPETGQKYRPRRNFF